MSFFKNLFGKKSAVPQVPAPSGAPVPEGQPMPPAAQEEEHQDDPTYECMNCGYTSNQPGGCPNCGIPLRVVEKR